MKHFRLKIILVLVGSYLVGLGLNLIHHKYMHIENYSVFNFTNLSKNIVAPLIISCIIWLTKKRISSSTKLDIVIITLAYISIELIEYFLSPDGNFMLLNLVGLTIGGFIAVSVHNLLRIEKEYLT